ncbi:UvrD-helicase domain-containing protein [Smaragdicoccus niigatensis]|uniref:UvrD-helicase domain-containing protein n=1 Tax=Smaragdicoccus niigatensis TaxID=359359 RepID=UPI000374D765|nr:UvrD-helicase domain-containing protein [Smaragdicoccus niigatensis]
MSDTLSFDLLADLPTGTSILEASAGTGKTYAITALAVRCIAEGKATIDQLLVITFTNAATSEVRERVRHRFVEVSEALNNPGAAEDSDDLVRFLAAEDVEARRDRLALAVSNFDQATIVTTLSFCQRMLESLGIVGDRDPHAQFVEEPEDLWAQVYADEYLARFASAERQLNWDNTTKMLRVATKDSQSPIVDAGGDDLEAGQRWRLAVAARAEIDRRKRLGGIRDYSDLLSLLAETLRDDVAGPIACERIRGKYAVALIDEFQDTDPLQWEIVEQVFHGHVTLLLVGDPKQAIYGFRGADVFSYLNAKHKAHSSYRLEKNWRSDDRLLKALDFMWGGAALGDEEIVVTSVEAEHPTRITTEHPIRVRYLSRLAAGPVVAGQYTAPEDALPKVDQVRPFIARDVAADILRLLNSGATISNEPVTPGDIAVLVRTNEQAEDVAIELDRLGVPSVLTGNSSIFATAAARNWMRVLQALESPYRSGVVRLAAMTPLLGYTAEKLDTGGDDLAADLGLELRVLAELVTTSGFAAMFERLVTTFSLFERLLATQSGERDLTDLRHLAETLNRAVVEEARGITSLIRWLSDRMNDVNTKKTIRDKSRRLESDAAAVQIGTIHVSKGLEYPIVYVPFAWDTYVGSSPDTLTFHQDGSRWLDVGGPSGKGYDARRVVHQAESVGEQLRLFYVALTRAKCQLVLWWAPTFNTPHSPLQRMTFGRANAPTGIPPEASVVQDDKVSSFFEHWASRSGGLIGVERVAGEPIDLERWQRDAGAGADLTRREFTRDLDVAWRRTSYSALTAQAHEHAYVASEPDLDVTEDEPNERVEGTGGPLPMNVFAGGTAFGTLVHEILEYADTDSKDLRAELVERCREAVSLRGAGLDVETLANCLFAVMQTPLGFGSLAKIPTKDRLAELDFELPLQGGSIAAIADLFARHADGPLANYADQLRTVESNPLRGFLTGSIDAVIRTPAGKFLVVDYKTNRIGSGELTIDDYAPGPMATAMMQSHYPLQAILYCVALHRYLRWRLPGYSAQEHLAGVQYHFVRGMIGPETPAGHGVFEWHPPARMVEELSELLGGVR